MGAPRLTAPLRILVSHSTRDTEVRVFWRFLDELQQALDAASVPVLLVNVVSECSTKVVDELPAELAAATQATDATMMVLTRGYVDSVWCDDEMHARARSACSDCPSHRLFPLAWRTYPWDELWSRKIDGWGVDLQPLMTDALLAQVEAQLWQPEARPQAWHHALRSTVQALQRFVDELDRTCRDDVCPARVLSSVPVPQRLD